MNPEDIPEDVIEGYPCPICESGSVTKVGGMWQCDSCNFNSMMEAELKNFKRKLDHES